MKPSNSKWHQVAYATCRPNPAATRLVLMIVRWTNDHDRLWTVHTQWSAKYSFSDDDGSFVAAERRTSRHLDLTLPLFPTTSVRRSKQVCGTFMGATSKPPPLAWVNFSRRRKHLEHPWSRGLAALRPLTVASTIALLGQTAVAIARQVRVGNRQTNDHICIICIICIISMSKQKDSAIA